MNCLISNGENVTANTYKRYGVVFEKGEGVYMIDKEGNRYLDFVAGIAVNALGYSNDKLKNALKAQIDNFTHCSNLYWNEPAIKAAEKLVRLSGLDKVFFCNSGAEANEGAMKLARKYAKKFGSEEKVEIISMKNSFHGRTLATVTATGQTKYQKGYDPLLPGVQFAVYNDIESVKNLVNEKTCAIIIEPIQGEGGIVPANPEFLKEVRKICTEKDIVLIFDEVQAGMGRSGHIFAYEHYHLKPDIVTLAKGLGAGVPVGAFIACDKVAKGFEPGDHASTFGGGPLVCTAINVVLDELEGGVVKNVALMGAYLYNELLILKEKHDCIMDVRGRGLMQGIQLKGIVPADVVKKCMSYGLLLVGASTDVVRLVPPLVVTKEDIDKAISILDKGLQEVTNS
jgi:acetylornithine/N-succinyldiaminopimelate aminotransferase